MTGLKRVFFYGLLILVTSAKAQEKISIAATRTHQPPKIDGKLNDECWKEGNLFSDFIQSVPEYGPSAKDRTEIIVLYDDNAVYLSAKCFMNADSIWMQFTERDDIFDNTDVLSIAFDTYHDGQNGFAFGVSPRNVQADFKFFQNDNSDNTWDAVWESEVYMADDGWYVEMKIPYSALRFPKVAIQNWHLDVYRIVRRNRHEYHSAGINPKENGVVSQFQPLIGVSNIQPPLRLSVSPYATVYDNLYTSKQDNISDNNVDFKGGIDLKWGINESFTLDATLIPDFGQVQSDNLVYNLSAFEVQYDENRSFFTEGTELFNKADLFYSRRIGFVSDYYESHTDTNVTLLNYPSATPLLNATKISGRTKNGLGIGLFNAITSNTYADASNGEGAVAPVLVDPLTNFNVLVLDQSLKNNSYITFTNANVLRDSKGRNSNVASLMTSVKNKKNTYSAFGYIALSTLMNKSLSDNSSDFVTGYLNKVAIEKISGNLTFYVSHLAISPEFNQNDLGFLNINNENIAQAGFNYDIYKPFGKFNEFHSSNQIEYNYRNNDGAYSRAYLNGFTMLLNKNYFGYFSYYFAAPFGKDDYYEPRTVDRFYHAPAVYELGLGISTDYRKHIALDVEGGPAIWNEPGRIKYRWVITPRLRIGDRLFLLPQNNTHLYFNDVGYVTTDSLTNIIFGRRDVQEFDNSISGNYVFNSEMSLGLKVRYYSQKGEYDRFYNLQTDGSLLPSYYNEEVAFNFNAWNIDLNFTWWFLPGSEINLVWKNSIVGFDENAGLNFIDNFHHTLDFPQNNNFSIRIRYYLDYQDVKRWVN